MKCKTLIIGAGNKGILADAPGTGNEDKFLSYAHAIKEHPELELIGFVDSEISKTVKATKIYGGWGAKNINFIEHENINIDVAIVSAPDETHYGILKQLTNYPLKLVICEKPICTGLDQAREIVELYKSIKTPLMIDYTRRFIPRWQEAKAEIDSGKSGKFLKGYCYFNRGWLHTASHFVDLALWFNDNLDNIIIQEVPTDYRWVFQWGMFYENEFYSEHAVNFTKNPHVDSMYDQHLRYVIENAYNFLEGKERLICDANMALKTITECFKLAQGE
jgi:hypothetical protein